MNHRILFPLLALLLAFATFAGCGSSGSSPSSTAPDAGGPDVTTDAGHPLCKDGQSVDGPYPKADYSVSLLGTLPDMTFGDVSLHDYYEPCAPQSRILVLRVGAGWCGTCRWHLAHTGELAKLDIASRIEIVDLVLQNDDGIPPTDPDVQKYASRIDAPGKIAADPKNQLAPVNPQAAPLPLIVLVDTRTMIVENVLSNPDPQMFVQRIRQALADADGVPEPPYPLPEKFDGTFLRNQWDMLHDMTLPGAPPPDTTNAKADDPAAAALGKKLFSDASLSPSGTVSCATCHDPTKQFTDGLSVSEGVSKVDRNAPALALVSHQRWQFWDGRADSVWAQALGPFENPREFASSRLFVAHAMFDRYQADYTAVFGALPPLSDTTRFPPAGKPGDAAWNAMPTADQNLVTGVYVNVGKAIAAYERTLRVKPNRLDQYIGGELSVLSGPEKSGLLVFMSVGCPQCHWGPRLTDDAFHATRFPGGRVDGKPDMGRADGIAQLVASEFLAGGAWSDDKNTGHGLALTTDPSMVGAFKTPSLRGVPGTAPYGHGGQLQTLLDVVTLYSQGGLPATDTSVVGTAPPWLVSFDHSARDALVPFLNVLTGEIAP